MVLLAALAHAKPSVTLTFQCLGGEHADIVSTFSRTDRRGDGSPEQRTEGSAHTTESVELRDGVCRVTERSDVDASGMPPAVAAIMDIAARHPTTTLLDGSANVVGLDGLDSLAEALRAGAATLVGESPEQAPLLQFVESLVSEPVLMAQEVERWGERATFWHGARLKPGKESPVVLTSGVSVQRSVAPAPCPDGRGTCVLLQSGYTIEVPGLLETVRPLLQLLESQGIDPASVKVSGTKTRTQELLVDPATLRPFVRRETDVIRVEVALPGNAPTVEVRTSQAESQWTWPSRG